MLLQICESCLGTEMCSVCKAAVIEELFLAGAEGFLEPPQQHGDGVEGALILVQSYSSNHGRLKIARHRCDSRFFFQVIFICVQLILNGNFTFLYLYQHEFIPRKKGNVTFSAHVGLSRAQQPAGAPASPEAFCAPSSASPHVSTCRSDQPHPSMGFYQNRNTFSPPHRAACPPWILFAALFWVHSHSLCLSHAEDSPPGHTAGGAEPSPTCTRYFHKWKHFNAISCI